MRTRVLRRPIVFLRVRRRILILLIKTVRCSIPHCTLHWCNYFRVWFSIQERSNVHRNQHGIRCLPRYELAGLLRLLDSLFLDQQRGHRAQINDLMRQKYRLYNRQLFDASITIGRHILIRTDVANEAFVIQGGSNMTGTDLCINKPHCAATERPWKSEATTSTLPPARVRTCSVLSGSC